MSSRSHHKRLPIFAYHAIAAARDVKLPSAWSADHAVLLESFRRHLEFMQMEGWRTVLPDAMETPGGPNHQRYFIATFDDGHASDVLAAATMNYLGYRAIFYVPWSHIGSSGFLSSSELRALVADGFAVGSHGLTHSPLTQKPDDELHRELFTSKERLEDLIGERVEDLAVPFGRYDRRVIAAAKSAGYRRIMTSNVGFARAAASGVYPRLPVTSRTSLDDFRGMLLAGPAGMTRRRLSRAISKLLPAFPKAVFGRMHFGYSRESKEIL